MVEYPTRNLLSAPAFRYFHEVAQAGSFRKAGESLRIAPSAVHRQVTLLEAQLGTPLFERQRGRKGVKLTAAGEVLKLRIGQAVIELGKAVEEIQALSDVQRGRVAIGVNDTLASDLLSDLIISHHQEMPRLDFDVEVGPSPELAESMLNGNLDATLCFGAPMRLGMRTIWQGNMETAVLVHRDHPLARKRAVTLGECVQYPLAMQRDSEWTRGFLEGMFRQAGLRPRTLLTTNSFILMREVVASGSAISIQTHVPGLAEHRHLNLAHVKLKGHVPHYSVLSCCVPMDRRIPPASFAFIERVNGGAKVGQAAA
ncbi:MAG: hypothetical protein DI547_17105 [Sphingobium sp.]|nr:MAG: hypothetical protein DI547_17105 [Sphingobium sp.]